VRALLAAHDDAVAHSVELRVVVPSPAVWRLLVLVGGDVRLRIYPDMKSALTGAPGAARHAGPHDSASTTPGMSERYQEALRFTRQVMERVAVTKDILEQPRSASTDGLLRNSEFARLFQRVSTMPVIEQAKGILMFYEHCSADEAFDILRRASQRSNVPVRDIAAHIVARTVG
jgi:hypothetical protein